MQNRMPAITWQNLEKSPTSRMTGNPAAYHGMMKKPVGWRDIMLYSALLVLMGSTFLMLRLGPGGTFPRPLTKEEENRCVEQWVEQGDLEARNTLIEHNLRLVAHVIKKYYSSAEDMDDLISIGTIGLIKGINTYRPDKGVRLATYASRCIENAMLS